MSWSFLLFLVAKAEFCAPSLPIHSLLLKMFFFFNVISIQYTICINGLYLLITGVIITGVSHKIKLLGEEA